MSARRLRRREWGSSLASLAMLLAFSVPALAQGAGAETAAGAGNDAPDGSESSEPDAAPDKVAGLTMLPETGGASLLALCAGVLLSGAGVLSLIRRPQP
jgi:hypothetical protein